MQPVWDLDKYTTKLENSEHLRSGSWKRALKLRWKILKQKKAECVKSYLWQISVARTLCYTIKIKIYPFMENFIEIFCRQSCGTHALRTKIMGMLSRDDTLFSLIKSWLKPKKKYSETSKSQLHLAEEELEGSGCVQPFSGTCLVCVLKFLDLFSRSLECNHCSKNHLLSWMGRTLFKGEMGFSACFISYCANFKSTYLTENYLLDYNLSHQ